MITPLQFTLWLAGFLDACDTNTGLSPAQLEKISDNLKKVSDIPTYPSIDFESLITTTENSNLVPYHTICGCNPAIGGSGICGCVMGNKLVPKNNKSNNYTTTSDNTKFNWYYENK